MNFSVVNLGCKVNKVESDSIALAYMQRGGVMVEPAQAQTIVVNTCTVTSEAEKKTRKAVRRALRENPDARVLVTGCAAAINPQFYEGLDPRVFVVDKAELLSREGHGEDTLLQSSQHVARVGQQFPTRVGVKVQDGCAHACTYCIVHVARGKPWSRPLPQVVEEVRFLEQQGVREVVLTGIDLASYRANDANLGGLLDALLTATQHVRFRISSVEPRSFDAHTLELMAQGPRVCSHLHIPLQAGSNAILKAMARPYTAEFYRELVQKVRTQVPDIALTTDIIVGFPGESEEDFQATLALANEAAFSKVHVFRYSARPGTPAANMANQVDEQENATRAQQLSHLADELRVSYAQSLVGTSEYVVMETPTTGTSEHYFTVEFNEPKAQGELVRASLTSFRPSGIFKA